MNRSFLLVLFLLSGHIAAQAQESTSPEDTTASKKYIGAVELGYLYQKTRLDNGFIFNSMSSPTLTIFNGYRFHRLFNLGITVGTDYYTSILVSPLALGIRGSFFNTRVSPYYSLDTGYGFTFLSAESESIKSKGGWMINPGLGLKVRSGNHTAFLLHAGYKTQKVQTESNQWNTTISSKRSFNRLSLRIGFEF